MRGWLVPNTAERCFLTQLSHSRLPPGGRWETARRWHTQWPPRGDIYPAINHGEIRTWGDRGRKRPLWKGKRSGRKLGNHPSNAHMVISWHGKERVGAGGKRCRGGAFCCQQHGKRECQEKPDHSAEARSEPRGCVLRTVLQSAMQIGEYLTISLPPSKKTGHGIWRNEWLLAAEETSQGSVYWRCQSFLSPVRLLALIHSWRTVGAILLPFASN